MKTVIKILLAFSAFFLVLFLVTFILTWKFEEKFAGYAISELNQYLRTPVRAGKIDLTLIRKFPDVSIRLRNVFVSSVKDDYTEDQFNGENTDTLLHAQDIFLQFNLIGLIRNQYIIEEVQVNKGKLNIYTDLDGNVNYRFWKKSGSPSASGFRIDLQNVKISEIDFKDYNLSNRTTLLGNLNRIDLKGDFISEDYILDFILNGKVKKYTSGDTGYIIDKELIVKSKINVSGIRFQIIKTNFQFENLGFDITGNIVNEKPVQLDLDISGTDLNIENLYKNLSFLISEKSGTNLEFRGGLSFNAQVSGRIGDKEWPAIESEFSVRNGVISSDKTNQNFESINLKGYYSNGQNHSAETSVLRLENASIRYGNSVCSGTFNAQNLTHPLIDYQVKAQLDILDIVPFLKTGNLDYKSGFISLDARIRGEQERLLNISRNDVINWELDGKMELKGMMLELKNQKLLLKQINGNLDISDYLIVNDLSMVISGNELIFKGQMDHYREYLLTENAKLWMDLNIYCNNLIVDSLINRKNQDDTGNDSSMYILPGKYFIKSKFWFDRFSWDEFSATNVLGDLIYKPGSFLFTTEFSSMGGTIKGNGFVEQQNDLNYSVKLNSNLEKIDINNLFRYFRNFGQTYIQDKHLKGQISGTVSYYSLFSPWLRVDKKSILAESDIQIVNGELIDFEPMLGLSNFIDVEELRHIKFSTLENQIFIRNSEVMIPQMDIFSSALNVSCSGTHKFDNQFNYKVNVELSDLLLRNSRKENLEFEEHVITDDGLQRTKIYLTIEGTPDDYHINYDRKSAVSSLKGRLSEEKVELKSILKEEFGLFSKDTLPGVTEGGKKHEFIIEWEESIGDSKDTSATGDTKKNKRFLIDWDDEEADTIKETIKR